MTPASPHNHRKHWGVEESDRLKRLAAQNKTVKEIAKILGRTESSIRGRATRLKIKLYTPPKEPFNKTPMRKTKYTYRHPKRKTNE